MLDYFFIRLYLRLYEVNIVFAKKEKK